MSGYARLRSGQLAQAAGAGVQTLRYYERRGLLAEPDRTLGGHRLYTAEAVTILRVIKAAQRPVKTTSKGGAGLSVLAGIACVACCALPALIAAGALSGSGAAFLAGKMPVIAIILAIAAALAFAVAARCKTRTSGCGDSCRAGSGGGGCGCPPSHV